MTKSLFQAADNAEIVRRIRLVRADSQPRWGKMDAAQMMAHLQQAFRVATGDLVLQRVFIGHLFGWIAKKQLTNDKPFGRNLPTDKTFKIRDARDFARERDHLEGLVQAFGAKGPAGLTREPHPFFGRLTTEEWEGLMWKHSDHHLRQFGA